MLGRSQVVAENTARVYFQHMRRMAHHTEKGLFGNAFDKTKELATDTNDKLKEALKAAIGGETANTEAVASTSDEDSRSLLGSAAEKKNELRENLSEALESLKEKVAEQWEVMTGVEAPKDELNAQENYENLSGSDQQNLPINSFPGHDLPRNASDQLRQ
ncbi:unnamed protein product [Caenorhabditis auriculariae]|uniref:Uncharacterized protein n=1 Tax=Caenorhabditis auriculariae TaxID=2777116 RepID=A0A8S1HVG9_9PELO|nr:unnamed protein product [Caenorhabditis auriculariae]